MTDVVPMSPGEVLERWEVVEPLIQRVYETMPGAMQGITIDELVSDLQQDLIQAWSINDLQALAMTMIRPKPERHLFIFMVSGDGQEEWFFDLMEELEGRARLIGCRYSECCARPGWGRVARPIGYREQYRILRKELD